MDSSFRSDRIEAAVRKRRTLQSRRPKNDQSSFAKSPSPGEINLSSDENTATNSKRKEVSVNHFVNPFARRESTRNCGSNPTEFKEFHDADPERISKKPSTEGLIFPVNGTCLQTNADFEKVAIGGTVKKVKLIVGGVTRTIQANTSRNETSSLKTYGLRGLPRKNFQGIDEFDGKKPFQSAENENTKFLQKKSKRVLKKRSLDGDFGEDEIPYLEKVKKPKMRKISFVSKSAEDADNEEGDELASEPEEATARKESPKQLRILTTRQQAVQLGKGGVAFEFSDALPPARPRKQKERTESQLKKAEAAERRKLQSEKAARESEAEAIRKILGQDSGKKKREEKIKRKLEDLAREKAANSLSVAADMIRWVMRPTGTVVTFPAEAGLPSLFSYREPRYPPLREQCAGPECSNPYRYRDSKSKLPLCSLQCYKAIKLPL